ncbi:hypothetical protein [Lysinibacillus fusiformis]|nr:hypothetical protein [Lysinibacillus fusiformis]
MLLLSRIRDIWIRDNNFVIPLCLYLPPFLEERRQEIEEKLTPIE